MNRIDQLFQNRKAPVLSIYFCAGHPRLENTLSTLRALQDHQIDMIEIGIPFSDPMADGPVIQHAATQALNNGMSLRYLFHQLENARPDIHIPLVLMGYLNPILQFGFQAFCEQCQRVGIDGVIIPDLPFQEYLQHYKPVADQYKVKFIMLITPETSEARIRQIDEHTDGFIYMVSSAAITGSQKIFNEQKQAYFRRIEAMKLKNPLLVGFGISNRQTLKAANAHAAGTIIGSKFVQLLEAYQGNADLAIEQLKRLLETN